MKDLKPLTFVCMLLLFVFAACNEAPNVASDDSAAYSAADSEGPVLAKGPDKDGDGINNGQDNCPNEPNPGQEDADGDGIGDACDNDGGGGGDQCNIAFDVTFDDSSPNRIRSDNGTEYQHKVDHVMAFAAREGWRFDTDGGQGVPNPRKVRRRVTIDFVGSVAEDDGFGVDQHPIDFRKPDPDAVALCEMDANGGTAYQLAELIFYTDNDGFFLSYGCLDQDSNQLTGTPATLTRVSEHEWTMEGTTACLREGRFTGTIEQEVDMPFKLTMREQGF